MTFFLPLLLILLAGMLVNRFFPGILNVLGWLVVLEDRLGSILFLVASAIMATVAFWYPGICALTIRHQTIVTVSTRVQVERLCLSFSVRRQTPLDSAYGAGRFRIMNRSFTEIAEE